MSFVSSSLCVSVGHILGIKYLANEIFGEHYAFL